MKCLHKKTIIIGQGISYACLVCGRYNLDGIWYNSKVSFSRLLSWARQEVDKRHQKEDYKYFITAVNNSRKILNKFYLKKNYFERV